MTNKPVSGEPGRSAELQEAIDAANVRWGQAAPAAGPELILVSPDIPVWRRWLSKWASNRMLVLTAVIAAGTIALVVLAILAFVL
jgi:hypothetical protein